MRLSSLLVATLAALSSAAPIEADPAQNGTALEERNGDPPQATLLVLTLLPTPSFPPSHLHPTPTITQTTPH